MPGMKAVGTKTAMSTSEIAIIAAPNSFMVRCDAVAGSNPCSMLRSTFSTTTIASSTTMPMASTRPKSVNVFSENPNADMTANVAINEDGVETIGMIAVRQDCRNTRTTTTTSAMASNSVL